MARRGLGGTAYTKKDLKAQAKECGSHYFDPSTMRFFNARLLSVYPVPNKNVTYFVEAKGGSRRSFESIPRHYMIGVFKGCQVSSIGRGIGSSRGKASGIYKDARQAKKVAAAIAKKASGGGATKIRRRRR